jgi:uncharacterized Zn finger protein
MTNDEFIHHLGNVCPNCGSGEVESGGLKNKDADYCTFNANCTACGATWTETYTLQSYSDLAV